MQNNPKSVKLAIIGGGAAGMFAAAAAAERNLGCVLFERKARIGSKVLMTANGRCNFTKDISVDDFLADLGPSAGWASAALRDCPPRRIIQFFRSLGIPLRRMADARMFPADGKAATIVHAFGDIMRDCGVPLLTNSAVKRITKKESLFIVETENFGITAENVLVTTGGVSYPKTGSVGDGQRFAKELGHKIVPLRPGLIGMETGDRRITSLAGRRFEDARAKVISPDGKTLFDYRGEVDCENFGLSGAAIYNSQRYIMHAGLKDFTLEVWIGHERMQFQNLHNYFYWIPLLSYIL